MSGNKPACLICTRWKIILWMDLTARLTNLRGNERNWEENIKRYEGIKYCTGSRNCWLICSDFAICRKERTEKMVYWIGSIMDRKWRNKKVIWNPKTVDPRRRRWWPACSHSQLAPAFFFLHFVECPKKYKREK